MFSVLGAHLLLSLMHQKTNIPPTPSRKQPRSGLLTFSCNELKGSQLGALTLTVLLRVVRAYCLRARHVRIRIIAVLPLLHKSPLHAWPALCV
eukprot:3618825-Pyramimonas_sp.AAC.1